MDAILVVYGRNNHCRRLEFEKEFKICQFHPDVLHEKHHDLFFEVLIIYLSFWPPAKKGNPSNCVGRFLQILILLLNRHAQSEGSN